MQDLDGSLNAGAWPATLGHVAECFGELNLIHPFREGNGRALRLFFEHLFVVNGMAIDWGRIDRDEWLAACIAAVACDYSQLASLFDRCVITATLSQP